MNKERRFKFAIGIFVVSLWALAGGLIIGRSTLLDAPDECVQLMNEYEQILATHGPSDEHWEEVEAACAD